MEGRKKFLLFADECGDQCLSKYDSHFPVFTLCGIVVSRDQIRQLELEIKEFKNKYLGSDGVILHSHEIRRCYVYDGNQLGLKLIK